VHWLTWHDFITLLTTWQGLVATLLTVIAALYYGPKKLLETWDWYLDLFRDAKIMNAIRVPKPYRSNAALSNFGPQPAKESGYEVLELMDNTGCSENRVRKALVRLEKRGKVHRMHDGKWIRKGHS
jgi:hypothetical protein